MRRALSGWLWEWRRRRQGEVRIFFSAARLGFFGGRGGRGDGCVVALTRSFHLCGGARALWPWVARALAARSFAAVAVWPAGSGAEAPFGRRGARRLLLWNGMVAMLACGQTCDSGLNRRRVGVCACVLLLPSQHTVTSVRLLLLLLSFFFEIK